MHVVTAMRGYPVGEGNGPLVLCQPRKHLQENLLAEVFLGHAPRQVRPHDADNQRVQVLHQLPRRLLVPSTHAIKTRHQINGRRVGGVGHPVMEARAITTGKTCLGGVGYSSGHRLPARKNLPARDEEHGLPARDLDFASARPLPLRAHGNAAASPPTYERARPLKRRLAAGRA